MANDEELVKAGVLLAADGLHPSSKGARISFSGGKRAVTDGPFTEAKELITGFWMILVKSKEEAIKWTRRVPFVRRGDRGPPGVRAAGLPCRDSPSRGRGARAGSTARRRPAPPTRRRPVALNRRRPP